jgi:hypothetical protein
MMKMKTPIKRTPVNLILSVCVTDEIRQALETVAAFEGIRPSQFGRMAILERLVRQGYMRHPGQIFQEAQAAQAAKNMAAE